MLCSFFIGALSILVGLVLVALTALYIYFQNQYKYWEKRNVPHAKPTFPLGCLSGSNKTNLGILFKKLYDEGKNHRYYGIWQIHKPTLMINDLDLIKRVLVGDFMNFHDHGVFSDEEKDPLSANLFSLEGVAWKNLRAKLSPTFTSGKMKLMFPIMVDIGKELTEVLKEPASLGEVIEVKEYVARFTTDIISSCAFGIEANSLKNPDSILRKMGKKIFEPKWEVLIRNMLAFLVPDVAKILRITVNPKEVSDFFLNTFKDMTEYREKNNIKRNDVLQLLIQLKNQGYIDDVDNKNRTINENDKFTMAQAAAQAFIFFVGGFETSSTTMQYALYELAMNPKIQKNLREEIKRVLDKHQGKMTYEAIYQMELLGRVIDETLRKYPPAPVLSRVCTKDFKVPDSDLVIEKGTNVAICAYGLHMDERYFPNPEKFDPDRFTEEEKQSRNNYTYLPFGEGPRFCIGQRFGLMQTRVGLITLLSNYKFEVSIKHTPIPIEFDPKSFIFAPKGGMNLKISLLDEFD